MSDQCEYIMQLVNHAAYAIEDNKVSVRFDFPYAEKDSEVIGIRLEVRLDQFGVSYRSVKIKGDSLIINL